ncbi:MAG: PilT/PilU family type 4a pilus ATPase, partial [Polyangiaceae bacterium]|nr:PilT/PilU family type 4a pilus ATPase [Polyangiaceae bacterium]
MDERKFRGILSAGLKYRARDIHFKVGSPPLLRILDELRETPIPKLSAEDVEWVVRFLLRRTHHNPDALLDEVETCFELEGAARFRASIFWQMGTMAVVLRIVPSEIPSFESLELPRSIRQVATLHRGLVLVAGVAGCGKSTTLASIIHEINRTRHAHIVTIEDPVEFVHKPLMSSVTQREVGKDTRSFNSALRAALRQDPDVILVGEVRDLDTIDTALRAAETGHLVLATIHTTDTAKTIGRLLGVFGQAEQAAVRYRLAENLKAVIAQRLLPRKDGEGMALACEAMFASATLQECIRDPARTGEITDVIEQGGDRLNTHTFDQHLTELYRTGVVDLETAKAASSRPG